VAFHDPHGTGYHFLADAVIELNTLNPQLAARLMSPYKDWKNYTPDRQEKICSTLERILSAPNVTPDVYEIASKCLNA
jgi:aminopeptidase N